MASNDVVLGAALRTNLLSLQSTQRSIDVTQLRLATGKKVNSALDNPQNFFASEALNNRASDLTNLLDGIGQSISTITEADKGVTSLTGLIEQAQSVVNSARDALAANSGEARAVGNVDLRTTDLVADLGIANGANFDIYTTDANGDQITENIAIQTGDTAYSLAARITNQFKDNQNGEISASVTKEGYLSIQSSGGKSFKIVDDAAGGTPVTLANFQDLGLDKYFETETRNGVGVASATIVAGNTIKSISLYESPGNRVEAGDLVTGAYTDAAGNTALSGLANGDTFSVSVNISGGAAPITASLGITANTSFQDLVDTVNQDTNLNPYIEASFDSNTGSISFTSKLDTVDNVNINFTAATVGTVINLGLGDGTGNLDPQTTTAAGAQNSFFSFNNSTESLDKLAQDYNKLRAQIDDIVEDANYRGVNLLNGDDLVTYFNEDRSNKITTEGSIFTADGLGLNLATFRSADSIEATADETIAALGTVRSFGSSLANDLAIIQNRQTFTQETITTLKEGASKLTDADLNEEGANLLALQTRQQLGVTALSLASQSQQSVLRLF
ncbi:MAG: flagellin [Micavibrio aeruginosavorus]|uniref:Flagellin n=1 Tax=Micavibrio aeruginosavorus TaxID=349221 RepID=A0A2W5N4P6_9BACT|nr:MAG: flagellin [Micavibrio aeruginosavorus]